MDLQSSRNLEELFQLLNQWPVSIEEQMEYSWPPFGLMLEIKQQRLLMTSWLLDSPVNDISDWLGRWHPQMFQGVPQRLFLIKQRLMISCLCPQDFEGRDWYNILMLQQKLLSKVDQGGLV